MVAWGWPGDTLRTLAFLSLVGGLFLMAAVHRLASPHPLAGGNRWFPRMALAVTAATAVALAFPWSREVLGFALPTGPQWAVLPAIWAMLGGWLAVSVRSGRRSARLGTVERTDGPAIDVAAAPLEGKRQQRPRM
jgi:hypothetical protein